MFELFQKLPVPSVNLSIRARVVLLSVAWMTGLATVAAEGPVPDPQEAATPEPAGDKPRRKGWWSR